MAKTPKPKTVTTPFHVTTTARGAVLSGGRAKNKQQVAKDFAAQGYNVGRTGDSWLIKGKRVPKAHNPSANKPTRVSTTARKPKKGA